MHEGLKKGIVASVTEFFNSDIRKTVTDKEHSITIEPLPGDKGAFVLYVQGTPIVKDVAGTVIPFKNFIAESYSKEVTELLKNHFGCVPYYIERVGSFDDEEKPRKYYESREDAIAQAEAELEAIIDGHPDEYTRDGIYEDAGYGSLSDNVSNRYFSWKIRSKGPHSFTESVLYELDDAEDGLAQYSYELIDTGVCSGPIQKADGLILKMDDAVAAEYHAKLKLNIYEALERMLLKRKETTDDTSRLESFKAIMAARDFASEILGESVVICNDDDAGFNIVFGGDSVQKEAADDER